MHMIVCMDGTAKKSRLETAQERYQAAAIAAYAARVPRCDLACGLATTEPVTVSGWYSAPTLSGRPAWVRYRWHDGRLVATLVSYDPDPERAYHDAVIGVLELGGEPRQLGLAALMAPLREHIERCPDDWLRWERQGDVITAWVVAPDGTLGVLKAEVSEDVGGIEFLQHRRRGDDAAPSITALWDHLCDVLREELFRADACVTTPTSGPLYRRGPDVGRSILDAVVDAHIEGRA